MCIRDRCDPGRRHPMGLAGQRRSPVLGARRLADCRAEDSPARSRLVAGQQRGRVDLEQVKELSLIHIWDDIRGTGWIQYFDHHTQRSRDHGNRRAGGLSGSQVSQESVTECRAVGISENRPQRAVFCVFKPTICTLLDVYKRQAQGSRFALSRHPRGTCRGRHSGSDFYRSIPLSPTGPAPAAGGFFRPCTRKDLRPCAGTGTARRAGVGQRVDVYKRQLVEGMILYFYDCKA